MSWAMNVDQRTQHHLQATVGEGGRRRLLEIAALDDSIDLNKNKRQQLQSKLESARV